MHPPIVFYHIPVYEVLLDVGWIDEDFVVNLHYPCRLHNLIE